MPRQYRLSPEGRTALERTAAHARAARESTDRLIGKLEDRELTLEERDRLLGIVVRSEPNGDAKPSPETLAEIRRLFGGPDR
ncbi:hypothetical protein [Streptomyces canus]|uniref:hypothetical protein n=1 Tax=Streptomyces canus TaxID=58343 RepID=UPI00039E461C|nr:hypothetical protein [Streptomyces canus]